MLSTWNLPSSVKKSGVFKVYVKDHSKNEFTELFCQHIFVGHQKGEFNPSSLAVFDFDGEVDVKIIYSEEKISSCDIRPHSYAIDFTINNEDNSVNFTMIQNSNAPRKVFVRINNDWESKCLHLLTNPVEKDAPSKAEKNVFFINAGDDIPLTLPEGKDTYYFGEGEHLLPQGLWAELDLGEEITLNRFEILQGDFFLSDCYVDERKLDPLKFMLETKEKKDDSYTVLFDGAQNLQSGLIKGEFAKVKCRYIRIRMLGTTLKKGWIFSCIVSGLRLFSPDSEVDVALGKACDGAMPSFRNLTDGNPATAYTSKNRCGNWHAGESFFISKPNTKIYIAPGAVVKGSIASDDISNVSIFGRGILDSSELHHENPDPGEARTGAIWLTGGQNYLIEGITVLDAPMWQIVLNYSENIIVKNINLIGYVVNADGIHLSGCKNAVVTGSFVRTCDDLIVIYHYGATSNVKVSNCVFLNDDAHVFLYGLGETKDAYIKDMEISDCDIISQQEAPWEPYRFSGVFKFWAHGGNSIENIRIERVRIDSFRDAGKGCVFQFRTELRFAGEHPGEAVRGIYIKDLSVEDVTETPSLLSGVSCENIVSDIVFENYTRAGKKILRLEDANISSVGDVKNVQFI